MSDRRGYLYRRHGVVAGYGYLNDRQGPFALLDERDFPAALALPSTSRWARRG